MTYKLFLDDERDPKFVGWASSRLPGRFEGDVTRICRTYEEFVACIETHGLPYAISFDHDLGADKSGFDCANWLLNKFLDNPGFYEPIIYNVHSMNPVGAKNIRGILGDIVKEFG